jgi:hypothetical protein
MSKSDSSKFISQITLGEDKVVLKDPNAIEREKDSDVEAVLNFVNGFNIFGMNITLNKEDNTINFGKQEGEE